MNIWRAFHVKQVSFLHMADLHLDAPFSSLGDAVRSDIRKNELGDSFKSIIDKVLTDNIDLLLISGDFFEESTVRSSTILTVKNLFSELFKTEVIIIPGNHDPLRDNSWYKTTQWGKNVHILEDSQQVLYLEKYNAYIYNMGVKGDLKKDISIIRERTIQKECFNILLFHGTVEMPFEDEK